MASTTSDNFHRLITEVQKTSLKKSKLTTELQKAFKTGNIKEIQQKASTLKDLFVKSSVTLSEEGQHVLESLISKGTDEYKITKKPDVKDEQGPSQETASQSYGCIDATPGPKQSNESPQQAKRLKETKENKDLKDKDKFARTVGANSRDQQDEILGLKKKIEEQEVTISKLKECLRKTEAVRDDRTKMVNSLEKTVNDHYQKNSDLERTNETLRSENAKLVAIGDTQMKRYGELLDEARIKQEEAHKMQEKDEKNYSSLADDYTIIKQKYNHLEKTLKETQETAQNKSREDEQRYDNLKKEHDELKSRFSKLAASKLQDGNPDITDLSDPNRAMKLSEKFAAVYDDAWTDAFTAQTEKLKRSPKEAIQNMLDVLKECYTFCKEMAEQQMDSLRNILLHPCQDPDKLVVGAAKGMDRPRIRSKEEKELKDLRRKIGVQTTSDIRQLFMTHMQKKYAKLEDKSVSTAMAESMAFYEESAEVCWLMVLSDPPLYMQMDVTPGEKINPNLYTKYSPAGNTIEFLVWPTLFIEGGGQLSKGVVEPKPKK